MPLVPKRKPRPKPAPYNHDKAKESCSEEPSTSTKPIAHRTKSRENLTLHDWLTVFAFVDSHKDMPQMDVVQHFRDKKDTPLIFTQSTLSRKLKQRTDLEERANSNPNALSSKRPRVVTRPDVEKALWVWVTHMEKKGEAVSGPMLREKRRRFEDLFEVPEEERLNGDGWITSFCKTYKRKESRDHGEAEAGSVELIQGDEEIVKEVQGQMAIEERSADSEEVQVSDDDEEEDDGGPAEPELSSAEVIQLCRQLERVCLVKLVAHNAELALDLLQNLRCFRGVLVREGKKSKQTTLDQYWTRS